MELGGDSREYKDVGKIVILEWKPIGTRIRGRPRKRWNVNIEENMQIIIHYYIFIYCNWIVTRWQWLFYM